MQKFGRRFLIDDNEVNEDWNNGRFIFIRGIRNEMNNFFSSFLIHRHGKNWSHLLASQFSNKNDSFTLPRRIETCLIHHFYWAASSASRRK